MLFKILYKLTPKVSEYTFNLINHFALSSLFRSSAEDMFNNLCIEEFTFVFVPRGKITLKAEFGSLFRLTKGVDQYSEEYS